MKRSLKRFGIVSLPDPQRAGPVLLEIIGWLATRSFTIFLDTDTAQVVGETVRSRFSVCRIDEIPGVADIVLVLGGDGTLLRVARNIGHSGIIMLGVNLGSLGFLTDVKADDAVNTLERVINGRYTLDERMVLHATVKHHDGTIKQSSFALNDVVINSGPHSRLVNLSSSVDGAWINTFLSDGLIISTPTGSTAYSLSAGGPIIHPKLHAILITPICPHILTNRPIVIPDDERIVIVVQEKGVGNGSECLLCADGQVVTGLTPGDTVEVTKAAHTIKLIQPEGTDYYQVLRTKLKWGERG
ncbi:MAG: NAD(+)/NADH kinase [bacterium]